MTASHTPNFALQFVWSFGRILIAVSHEPCPHIRRITRGVTQDIDADRLLTRLTVHDADRHRHDRVRCNRDLATRRLRGSVLRYRFTGFCPESCCRTSGMGPAGRRTPGGVSDRRLGARKGPLYRDCPLSAFARGAAALDGIGAVIACQRESAHSSKPNEPSSSLRSRALALTISTASFG